MQPENKQTAKGENQGYKECMKGHLYIIVLPKKGGREGRLIKGQDTQPGKLEIDLSVVR